jgi:hypothetical protein
MGPGGFPFSWALQGRCSGAETVTKADAVCGALMDKSPTPASLTGEVFPGPWPTSPTWIARTAFALGCFVSQEVTVTLTPKKRSQAPFSVAQRASVVRLWTRELAFMRTRAVLLAPFPCSGVGPTSR